MAKKVFIVFVILFLTMLLGFAIHSISSEEESFIIGEKPTGAEVGEEDDPGGSNQTDPGEEEFNEGKLTKIIDGGMGVVRGVTLNYSTEQVLYYQKRNFLLANFNGKTKSSVGGYPFINVKDIKWNITKEKALVKDNHRYYIYDLNKNKAEELSKKIDYAVWFKYMLKDKIAYKFYDVDTGKRKLAIADSDGQNEEVLVEELPFRMVGIEIPENGSKVCYFREPDANFKARLNCVNLKTKQKEILHRGSFAADYRWAKNGNRILTSYVSEQIGSKMVLGSMNGKGGEFRSFNFPTSVDKCVWSKDNRKIYCAMMVFKEKNIILPNDWSLSKYQSMDTFWELDVETGKKRRLLESAEMTSVDATNLFLDSNEGKLFFTDKNSKSVYVISLK